MNRSIIILVNCIDVNFAFDEDFNNVNITYIANEMNYVFGFKTEFIGTPLLLSVCVCNIIYTHCTHAHIEVRESAM